MGKKVEVNKVTGNITLEKEGFLKETDVSILCIEECKDFYSDNILKKLIRKLKGEKILKVRDQNICANTTGTSELCAVRLLFIQNSKSYL